MSVHVKVSDWHPGLLSEHQEQAWDRFLADYAPIILQVAQHFGRDQDETHDCFVFACEKLKQDNLKKIRRFNENGSATFATWLRAVVRNLCLDWYRKRFGRPRIYRSIARLPELERRIFQCLHMRGLSESETFQTVAALYPSLTHNQFTDCVVRIENALSHRQSWLLASSSPRLVSIAGPADGSADHRKEREIADFNHDPEEEAARSEYLATLRAALSHLPKQQRLLVRLRFEQDLTLEQIANLTGLKSPRAVQSLLSAAVAAMRSEMTLEEAADTDPSVSVKDS